MTEGEVEAVRIYFKLTERQREVVRLLLSGVTSYERMAKVMGVAATTARSHMHAVMEATKTSDRAALLLYVLHRPILERFFRQGEETSV